MFKPLIITFDSWLNPQTVIRKYSSYLSYNYFKKKV